MRMNICNHRCYYNCNVHQCTNGSYTGNGTLCGLDSDSDGFPDGQLDCGDQHCEQVSTLPR